MATYTLISSQVLGSSAASVTFSSIPQTYKDLVLRCSARSDAAVITDFLTLQFNTDSAGSAYSYTNAQGNGASAQSGNGVSVSPTRIGVVNGASSTTSTFCTCELYIPVYTTSQNKPSSGFSATENNATTAVVTANAYLWRNTSSINQIILRTENAANFVTGSSFYLYGI